jgi:hypothetical protein
MPVVGAKADLIVTLVDSYGNPTPARSNLNVVLFSSDPNIADVSSGSLVIVEGSVSVKTTVVSTGREGSVTVTGSAPNMKSASAVLRIAGPQPTKITLYALKQLPVNDASNVLFIGITDADSNPVKLLEPKTISLYSSNTSVVSVQSSVTIYAGQWSAIVPLNCNLSGKSVTISAVSADLNTATYSLTGVDPTENAMASIKLYPIASQVPADEASQTTLLVQTLDASGKPTKVLSSLQITLSSDNTVVAVTPLSTSIQSGKSSTLITVTTKLPGKAVITAGSASYGTSTANVNSYAPEPDKVDIQMPPIPTNGEVDACLVALKGSTPVPVSEDTIFQFASSDTQMGVTSVDSVAIDAKTFMSYLKVKGLAPGQFSLTISASGIPSVTKKLQVLDTMPSTFKVSTVKPVVGYEFPILIQLTNVGGIPAVSSNSIGVNVVANDESVMRVPVEVVIDVDKTEQLFYAQALSAKQTVLTFSEVGFKSTTLPLTPVASTVSASMNISGKMPMNKPSEVLFTLKISGEPVEGAIGVWSGLGFTNSVLMTDESGIARNTYTLTQSTDYIEAKVKVGGGYLFVGKTIVAVPDAYHLSVTSNVPIEIVGSGTYSYGDVVLLDAPATYPMPHVFGLLGGKYVFVEWDGAVNTSGDTVSLTIEGDATELSVNAAYVEDMFMFYVSTAVIVIFAVIVLVVYRLYGSKIKARFSKPPAKPDVKAGPNVKPPAPKPPR